MYLILFSTSSGQVYITNYQSHTKIDRLLFIAKKLAGADQELEALRMAVDELKKVEGMFVEGLSVGKCGVG